MSIRKPNITGQNGEQYITKEPGAWSRYCDVFRLVLLPDGTRRAAIGTYLRYGVGSKKITQRRTP